MSNESKIGVINEQGDMGLGFDPISDEDAKKIKKDKEKEEDK